MSDAVRTGARNGTAAAAGAPAGPGAGRETVLVVEDERPVLELIADVLGFQGYRVLPAESGEDALQLSRRHPGPIHLAVVDVVMRGPSGPDLVQRLAAARPGLKTLYISGYPDELICRRGLTPGGQAFLQKPFSVEALASRVRELLDAG